MYLIPFLCVWFQYNRCSQTYSQFVDLVTLILRIYFIRKTLLRNGGRHCFATNSVHDHTCILRRLLIFVFKFSRPEINSRWIFGILAITLDNSHRVVPMSMN